MVNICLRVLGQLHLFVLSNSIQSTESKDLTSVYIRLTNHLCGSLNECPPGVPSAMPPPQWDSYPSGTVSLAEGSLRTYSPEPHFQFPVSA